MEFDFVKEMENGIVMDYAENKFIFVVKDFWSKEEIGFLIWNSDMPAFVERFGNIDNLEGRRVCGMGTIEVYKQHLQMKISNPTMLRLMKK